MGDFSMDFPMAISEAGVRWRNGRGDVMVRLGRDPPRAHMESPQLWAMRDDNMLFILLDVL